MTITVKNIEKVEPCYWWHLSDDEKEEYDYEGAEHSIYYRYRDQVLDSDHFYMKGHLADMEGWDAIYDLTYSSGYVLRVLDDSTVEIGYFYFVADNQ